MSNTFKVSVIIPVYNAAKLVEEAVVSALTQDEVGEVLLIEDGSEDNSLDVCRKLAKDNKVKLFQHKDGSNRGAGASRNVGIIKAKYDYIAFLDADDIYLKDRFKKDREVFRNNNNIDGVYNGVGTKFHDSLQKRFEKFIDSTLTTISRKIPPEELLDVLLDVHQDADGHFHLDGLTLKKDVVKKAGYFNEKLKLHQDTEWSYRLGLLSRLCAGKIESPVALRRVHKGNRYINNDKHCFTRFLMYSEVIRSSHFPEYPEYIRRIFMRRCLFFLKNYFTVGTLSRLPYTFYKFVRSYI